MENKLKLKKQRRQKIVLDFLPFIYNIVILIDWCLPYNSMLLKAYFGFSLFVSVELLLRSIDNDRCIWHQIPIYNTMCVSIIWIYNYYYPVFNDSNFIYLYFLFGFSLIVFTISAFFFFRKRIVRNINKCIK